MTNDVKNLVEPLTLEQLRGMRGKWVWIVSCDESNPFCGWAFVGKHHASTFQEYDEDLAVRVNYDVDEYGTSWMAYRYQPVNLDEWEPCEYCKGERAPYQHTHSTKLFIDTFGSARTLVTECNACPPYANCCAKDISVNSAFKIKFCPECGRPLTEESRAEWEKRMGVR